MLWSPNEVLAYVKEDFNQLTNEKTKNLLSETAAFGGFSPWSSSEDFIFVAENSEIYGPNALFTIPNKGRELDLHELATRILSADYQGVSSKKSVCLSHAQLLMPDITKDIHAAINYFLLFDSQARGFIRPTCIAYVTSDKFKLISLAEPILKALSEASTIFQHSNMKHCLEDLKSVKKAINTPLREASQDVQDIIDTIKNHKGDELIGERLTKIVEIVKKFQSSEISALLNVSPENCVQHHTHLKCSSSQNKQNKHKFMKDLLFTCSGSGLVLGLYHLFLMYKHFRRKYENLYLSKHSASPTRNNKDKELYFGACCFKISDLTKPSLLCRDCVFICNRVEKAPSLDDEQYFQFVDSSFEKILLDFLHWETNSCQDIVDSSILQSITLSDSLTEPESLCSSSSGYVSSESEVIDCDTRIRCGHIATLANIWDVIEDLQSANPGIESAFLEIIKLFDDSKKLLFSLLTRVPIVVISNPEEMSIAQNFVMAVSVFVPRKKDEVLFVDIDRQEPLETEYLKYIAAVNVCINHPKQLEEIIPEYLRQSLCILNLRGCSLTAPSYSGVLLSNIDERFRMLSLDGPAFPIVVGILCDLQNTLHWWHKIPSPSSYALNELGTAWSHKGYSEFDIQILTKLKNILM